MPLALVKTYDHIHYVLQDTPNVIEHAQKVISYLRLFGECRADARNSTGLSIIQLLSMAERFLLSLWISLQIRHFLAKTSTS